MAASSSSFISETTLPRSTYRPRLGVSRQPMRFMRVDLPEPDGPITATYSLGAIVKLTPRRAWISSAPMT